LAFFVLVGGRIERARQRHQWPGYHALSDIVRKGAKIPEEQVIMTCVAMGYPDDSFAANGVRSDREANGDFVRYVGFAD
jgi:hypothetical protein